MERVRDAARDALAGYHLPLDRAELSRAAAGARHALAERRANVEPRFLRERLRLERDAATGRTLARGRFGEQPSSWMLAAAVIGGVALGLGIGMWLTGSRAARREQARRMEAATDEIKAAWPELTDDDIEQARGSAARLAQTIRDRTGEDAAAVRERLAGMTSDDR
jgi:hypothetical protein